MIPVAQPTNAAPPRIIPLGIFVARRRKFFFVTPGNGSVEKAIEIAFSELPLVENGWKPNEAKIDVAPNRAGCTWVLER